MITEVWYETTLPCIDKSIAILWKISI